MQSCKVPAGIDLTSIAPVFEECRLANAAKNLIVIALYVLLAKLGLLLALKSPTITIFWPPGGFAIALMLLYGVKYLPGIFIGAVIAGFMAVDKPWVALMLGVADTVETYAGYWLLTRKLSFDPALETRLDFFKLTLLGGGIASAISALIGPTALLIGNVIPADLYPTILSRWWMGDVLGIAIFAPFILILKNPLPSIKRSEALEISGLILLTLITGLSVFFDSFHGTLFDPQGTAWLIIIVAWAGLRTNRHTVILLQLMIFFMALWSASQGTGKYANDILQTGLINFWAFGMVIAIGGLSIALATHESRGFQIRLELSERYQRTLLDNFPFAVWIKDPDSRFLTVNKGFVEIFGAKNQEELIGKNDFDIAPPDLANRYREDDRTVMATGRQQYVEEEILTAGERKWFETYKTPVVNSYGEVLGTVGFARDISQRKQAAVELEQRERHLSAILETTSDCVKLVAPDGTLLTMNAAGLSLIEADSADAVINQSVYPIIAPEFRDSFEAFNNSVCAGESGTMQFEVVGLKGTRKWMETHAVPFAHDKEGQVVHLAFTQEITQRKLTEAAIKESEARFRKLFELNPDPTFITSLEGKFLDVNEAACAVLGYSKEELLNMGPMDIDTQEFREQVPERITALKTHGTAVFESAHRTKKGDLIPVEISNRILSVFGTDVILGVARDLTARKRELEMRQQVQLENALVKSAEELQQSIGNELHDNLGQILSGISLLCRALQQQLNADNSRYSELAESIVQHSNAAINECRSLSSGLSPVNLEADDFLSALIGLAKRTEKLFDIDVEIEFDPQINIHDQATALHLYRIIQEATSNAIRHGKARRILIALSMKSGKLVLSVKDNGSALRSTAAETGAHSGMGLKIMRYRAQQIGAEMELIHLPEGGIEILIT